MKRPEFNVSAKSEIPNTSDVIWNRPNIDHDIRQYEIIYYITDTGNQNQITYHTISKVGSTYCHNYLNYINLIFFQDTNQSISSLESCKYYNITIRPTILNFGNDLSATTEIFVVGAGIIVT